MRTRIAANRAALGVGLLAALPVFLSAIRLLAADWTPIGDNAIIALRSYDVLSTHPPLLGQYSAASEVLGEGSYSLGPMLYWLLAVPSHIGASAPLVVTMCAVNAAAVVASVVLARRRGGTALMILTAVALVLMCASLPSKTWVDVWNPAAGLLPFTLLIFVAWSVACGEYRLLPLAVVVASFVAQAHLTYVVPAIGLLVVASIGLALRRRELDAGALRRWLLVALALAALCWSGPLVEQAVHRPGNLVTLARNASSDHPSTGFRNIGRDAYVRTAGVPPWWLGVADGPVDRFGDLARPPGALRIVSSLLVLAALVVVLVVGRRRGRRDLAAAAACALVLLAGVVFVASTTPIAGLLGITLRYTLWWASAAGMFAYVVIAWSALELLPRPGVWALRAAAAVAAVWAAVVLVRAGGGEDRLEGRYEPMRRLAAALERSLPADRTVLVGAVRPSSGYDAQYDYEAGAVYALRHQGVRVVRRFPEAVGSWYDAAGKRIDATVLVGAAGEAPPRGARLVARVDSRVVAWLVP